MVVRRPARGVTRVSHVPDDVSRVHGARRVIRVRGEVGVVGVSHRAMHLDREPTEPVRVLRRVAVERRIDRRSLRSQDVHAGVQVVAARVSRRPEPIPVRAGLTDGTDPERPRPTGRHRHGGVELPAARELRTQPRLSLRRQLLRQMLRLGLLRLDRGERGLRLRQQVLDLLLLSLNLRDHRSLCGLQRGQVVLFGGQDVLRVLDLGGQIGVARRDHIHVLQPVG